MKSTASGFLLVRMILTMLPYAQIVVRALHHKFDSASVDAFYRTSEMFWRATRYWFVISLSLLIAMFLFMNSFPYFNDLVILLGCLFEPTIELVTPTVLYWLLLRSSGKLLSISMKIGWFSGAVLVFCLLLFGTWTAVADWLKNAAYI